MDFVSFNVGLEPCRGLDNRHVTVFDAILTSRQTREKLQCLYENLMSNNFRRMAVLKKSDLYDDDNDDYDDDEEER